jgi:hypothetical protein
MAASPSSDPKSAGDDRKLVSTPGGTELSFEDRVQLFWNANKNLILGACIVVAVLILAKGGWDYVQRQKELRIQRAYAEAATTEDLKAFAASNRDHTLGGLAELRIADEAYAEGRFADAIAGYDAVLAGLKGGPLAARAQLGRALARLQGGQAEAGAAELQRLADDATQLRAARAEASYHLASLASATGDSVEVRRLSERLMQIDPTSPWVSRVMSLRAATPVAPGAAETAADEPASERADEGPRIQLNLPGR